MKLKHFLFGSMILVLVACIVISGWNLIKEDVTLATPTTEATEVVTETQPPRETLSVAIFPYLPNLELCQTILWQMWADIEPNVDLEFVYWDCFSDPDPSGIDVISYDAIIMDYLVEHGYIQPLAPDTIGNTEGILPFAMEGARHDGNLYGLPFLACSYFLIHYTEDEEMAQVQNFEELYDLLSVRKEWYSSDGLQFDIYDLPNLYLDALMDYTGTYTTFKEAPSLNPPDETIRNQLWNIASLIPEPADYAWADDFQERFAQGEGSAVYSFSESLYHMKDMLDQLTIRPISFSEGENIPLYYTDIASIGSHVTDPEKKETCLKFIDLLASAQFQAQLCYGTGDVQYLLPAREEVYYSAMKKYPLYEVLYFLVIDENNRVARFGPDIFEYYDDVYRTFY